ncbi:hypothetical protein [Salinimicrobium xinjiangense]|uniref:hypothetical protein n=1 Tax=Salinimicrobium xinjiangense TaxID=438596 RepID=UPI00040221D5|nr:hypothetical protein [Salinimicrobium xinjiangense]
MNFKLILFFLLVFLSLTSNGQDRWLATEQGNAFDGLSRMAHNTDQNGEVALTILNKANKTKIEFKDLEDFFTGALALVVNVDKNPTKKFSPVRRLLMSFDRKPDIYYVDFDADEQYISIKNAITSDFSKYLNRYEIIDLLKKNSDVHFRLIYKDDTKEDFTISLISSSIAIDKTLKHNSNYGIEIVLIAKAWADAWDDLYHWKISDNVKEVLDKEYGPYAYRLVDFIFLSDDKQELEIYLKYDIDELTIPREVFLKGALDGEGNLLPDPSTVKK